MEKYSIHDWIVVRGAREHNLKNIEVAIPKEKLTVITGPSGSGKSSLVLDILYAEGKRRYVESLSSYARQFLGIVGKPDVDSIVGLCPAIAIEQKTVGSNPRSTVGTITEVYDYLRVLFARVGKIHCPTCKNPIQATSSEAVVDIVVAAHAHNFILVTAPVVQERKGEFVRELMTYFMDGFYRFIIDGKRYKFKTEDDIKALNLKKTHKHTIDIIIDEIEVSPSEQSRIAEAIDAAFKQARDTVKIYVGEKTYYYSSSKMCVQCSESIPEIEPRFFSFNSPLGACKSCEGLGFTQEIPRNIFYAYKRYDENNENDEDVGYHTDVHSEWELLEVPCRVCQGKRLNKYALAVTIAEYSIYDLCNFSIKNLLAFFTVLTLDEVSAEIAATLLKEVQERLQFLYNVGLSYLTLNRSARTLSGGEGQRIRLATQIGSSLSGVLYILDEPSIGLHQRDNDRLIETLKRLRDLGNTVVVVEHDTDTMHQADYLIDMGPGAGILGGHITGVGTPTELMKNAQSLTGMYLSGKRAIAVPQQVRKPQGYVTLNNAQKNNLKKVTVAFPLQVLCGVSGVSGSGKSTLIMQELVPAMGRLFNSYGRLGYDNSADKTGGLTFDGNAKRIANMVVIDQSPIGRTPRSNPATYLGIFNEIRKLFASLPKSNARGYKVGRFSFNVEEGRCFECRGEGVKKIEMHFLPEVIIECKACKGKRYNKQTLEITYKDKNIADILDMTAYEALRFFEHHAPIFRRLELMCDVGLEYINLGQPATTLSGGEAQRIKLVDELAKRGNDTLYILDEPTTGLHTNDIERLLVVLNRLVDKGNSMIVIEHNLDVLKTVDYIIDLGPEGGDEGGLIVAQGTPQEVAHVAESYTGRYLKLL